MSKSKQIHIFATRSDLEPGLKDFESNVAVKFARCDTYDGPTFEQYVSLLQWDGLGKNTTGNHMTGASFLVVKRDSHIKVREINAGHPAGRTIPALKNALLVNEKGEIRKIAVPFDSYLDSIGQESSDQSEIPSNPHSADLRRTRHVLNQGQNPDSITFFPGGIFDNEKVLVCGHIGTSSKSSDSIALYKTFVRFVTKGFAKIGSYRVGPKAEQLMDQGYRMVTIGVSSSREYDLRKP